MKTPLTFSTLIVAAALIAFGAGCSRQSEASASGAEKEADATPATPPPVSGSAAAAESRAPEKRLPRLVDIGAGTCIPCRLMAPILDDLQHTRAHQFETVFVDLNHERAKGMSYGIRIIPTQVFFDENGRELYRHEGFFSKEDILKTWTGLGYTFETAN